MVKVCKECGKEYEAKTIRSQFCSNKCKNKNKNKKITKIKKCEWCGEEFIEYSNKGEKRFCSLSCGSKHMHSNMKEKILICTLCGKEIIFKGSTKKLYCNECRKKVNVKNTNKHNVKIGKIKEENIGIGSGNAQGSLQESYNFKTGIGIYRKIKKLSMEELKCEKCGSVKNLHVHHIDENRHNNELENLKLLCKPCHKKEHMGGEKNKFSKLKSKEVKFIFENPLNLSRKELSWIFNCKIGAICKIYNKETWQDTTEKLKSNIVSKIIGNIYLVNDEIYITSLEELKKYINYDSHKVIEKNIKENKLTKGYKIIRITKEDYIKVLKDKKDKYFENNA